MARAHRLRRPPRFCRTWRPARRAFRLSGFFVRLGESEASDAIADHDNSDDDQKHNHDRHIVLHQPFP
jgi:hypothetical protein